MTLTNDVSNGRMCLLAGDVKWLIQRFWLRTDSEREGKEEMNRFTIQCPWLFNPIYLSVMLYVFTQSKTWDQVVGDKTSNETRTIIVYIDKVVKMKPAWVTTYNPSRVDCIMRKHSRLLQQFQTVAVLAVLWVSYHSKVSRETLRSKPAVVWVSLFCCCPAAW